MPTLLLPLDGTALAEAALVGAQALTGNQRWTVRTLYVGKDDTGEHARYLERIAGLLRKLGHEVSTQVTSGDPAEEIANVANALPADLVIMKRDEREGWSGWMLGSITDKVVRRLRVPLLLVNPRPGEPQWTDYHVRHILVPLDASTTSEAAIDVALRVAEWTGARITLVYSAPWPSVTYGAAPELAAAAAWTPESDRELEASLYAYLDGVVQRYRDRIQLQRVAMRGRAVDAIVTAAAEHAVDLVVMTTSGAGAVAPMRLGSVAEGVIKESTVPVMLVRPPA